MLEHVVQCHLEYSEQRDFNASLRTRLQLCTLQSNAYAIGQLRHAQQLCNDVAQFVSEHIEVPGQRTYLVTTADLQLKSQITITTRDIGHGFDCLPERVRNAAHDQADEGSQH